MATHAHISALCYVLFRGWSQRASNIWKWQKSGDRKLSSSAKHSMTKLVLRENHIQMLIELPAEATKLALEFDDVIDKFFTLVSLEVLSKL